MRMRIAIIVCVIKLLSAHDVSLTFNSYPGNKIVDLNVGNLNTYLFLPDEIKGSFRINENFSLGFGFGLLQPITITSSENKYLLSANYEVNSSAIKRISIGVGLGSDSQRTLLISEVVLNKNLLSKSNRMSLGIGTTTVLTFTKRDVGNETMVLDYLSIPIFFQYNRNSPFELKFGTISISNYVSHGDKFNLIVWPDPQVQITYTF